ncbi:MAG: zinc ribbon domain-containing protein [Methanobrevibacter sp.]|nr:zinc ribbon domain-containing protein [Methanobrevibacter sp.]MBR6023906.1 zinc ribbon domain-containing protein [Methanobrevibacter sp.]
MKKCPECGNPSYDGAPVCGNCGYKFPKPKVKAPVQENIFEDRPIIDKSGNEESTLQIIKDNKIVIGAILLITLIVIGIIIATGPSNDTTTDVNGFNKYSDANFTFSYPSAWNEANGTDELHSGAIFFEGSNGTEIEYYNVTSDFSSISEINTQRASAAQGSNANINTIQSIEINGQNASDVILENSDGSFTRYVSLLNNGNLYAFKIDGKTIGDVTSGEIESVLQTAKY